MSSRSQLVSSVVRYSRSYVLSPVHSFEKAMHSACVYQLTSGISENSSTVGFTSFKHVPHSVLNWWNIEAILVVKGILTENFWIEIMNAYTFVCMAKGTAPWHALLLIDFNRVTKFNQTIPKDIYWISLWTMRIGFANVWAHAQTNSDGWVVGQTRVG